MSELKEFIEAIRSKLTDQSELIISKQINEGEKLVFRVAGKEKIQEYYKDIAPTDEQVKEYYQKHGEELKAMGEPEPIVYIPLIENKETGFFLYGYDNIKNIPFEILLSQEYHLFCFHYKKPKNDKTLELFLKYRIANTGDKELYWFEYKDYLNEVLKNPNRKVKPVFADFLEPNKAQELSDKLIPYIKQGEGKHIALCLKALTELDKLNFTKRQSVYDSLNLNKSQYTGANDFLNPNNSHKIKESELNQYKKYIQSLIDSL